MDLRAVVEELGQLAGAETAIADLYQACAASQPADAGFWEGLVAQERAHAAHLFEMAQMVNRSGGAGYRVQRAFPTAALRTFVEGVRANRQAVRDGVLAGDQLTFAALEIEHALVESKFHEFLQADDAAYNTFLRVIIEETAAHRAELEAKARDIRGRARRKPAAG